VDSASGAAPKGSAIDHIRSVLPSLVPSERRVARECVDFPETVVALSAADLAARTGTSAATVSRACQSLGYRGFQHMRLMLVRDLGLRQRADWRPTTGARGTVEAVFEGARRSIAGALDGLDYDVFDAAAATIAQARSVLLVATGGSSPAAQSAALALTVAGCTCLAPTDAVAQQLAAAALTSQDACVVITESGSNSVTLKAADAAHAAGAPIVALTAYARSRLAQTAAHFLLAGASYQAWDEDWGGGNVIHLLVLQALCKEVRRRANQTGRTEAVLSQALDIVSPRDSVTEPDS
jgi:DNA-binding MurR/RpiR family transcriptional regulator